MVLWRPYRLRKNWQFQEIIVEKQKVVNPSFVIFFTANNHNNCRFGISTPKKLFKLATDRNFYKRQVRAMLISHLQENGNSCQISNSHSHRDFVIIIRYPYLDNDFQTNQKNLYELLSTFQGKPNRRLEDNSLPKK